MSLIPYPVAQGAKNDCPNAGPGRLPTQRADPVVKIVAAFRGVLARPFGSVTPPAALEALRAGALVVDVRERDEWDDGHIAGAVHIPLGQICGRLDEIPSDGEVITVCRSGMRSSKAAGHLAKAGRAVSNMAGGMNAWSAAGLPVTRPGSAGRRRR
jgi:rhodanese-related sulfurtransferase